jgi:hypothetical protein
MGFLDRLRRALGGRPAAAPTAKAPSPSRRATPPSAATRNPRADAYFADAANWKPVTSSNLHSVAYFLDLAGEPVLGVRFSPQGAARITEYRYQAVPLSVYQDMLSATSKGRYTHASLIGRFACTGPY